MTVTPELIARIAAESRRALEPLVGLDWTVRAVDLDWTCLETGEHLAEGYFAHAARIVAQPRDRFVPARLILAESAGPEELLEVLDACAELLRCVAAVADPAGRAWHPWGVSDPGGSVAMGAAEGLVHTWDICAALGSGWRPPAELCAPVIGRLFPEAPRADPTDTLLWCTGRVALAAHPRQPTWRWYGAVPG